MIKRGLWTGLLGLVLAGGLCGAASATEVSDQLRAQFERAWSQPWPEVGSAGPKAQMPTPPPLVFQQAGAVAKSTGIPHCDDSDPSNDYGLILYDGYTVVYRNCPPEPVSSIFGERNHPGVAHTIHWTHPQPEQVGFFRLTETDPNGVITSYDLAADQFKQAFDKTASGPYGDYLYSVEACNTLGCNSFDAEYLWRVHIPAPAVPTQVTASFDDETTMAFTVNWQHPAPASVSHYWVEWRFPFTDESELSSSVVHFRIDSGQTLSFSHVPSAYGDYGFKVWACSVDRECDESSFINLEQPIPQAPALVSGELTHFYVDEFYLTWPASVSKNTTYYKIYQSKSGGPPVAYTSANTTSGIFMLLGEEGVFEYQVAACNSEDECTSLLASPTEIWYMPPVPFNVRFLQYAPDHVAVFWDFAGLRSQLQRFRVRAFEPVNSGTIKYHHAGRNDSNHSFGPGAQAGGYTVGVHACRLGNPVDPPNAPHSTSPSLEDTLKYCTRESERVRFLLEDLTPDKPEGLRLSWLQKSAYQYNLHWEMPEDSPPANRFEVEELGPGPVNQRPSQTFYLNSSDGSLRQKLFAKPSGPFGLYSYRVKACHDTSCSPSSDLIDWEVSERAIDSPEPPKSYADLPTSVTDLPAGSSEVGASAGEFRVDESGHANYSMPILTAPSGGGVAPQISLNYNSGAGNGPLGVGWNLGGLSAITRCGQTVAQDGGTRNSGVQVTTEDRLCLDGQRLIQINGGSYWATTAQYRTELESFSEITWQSANGVDYLRVRRKDGSISTYGAIDTSRVMTPGMHPEVFAWAISSFEDSAGNRIEFKYEQLQGDAIEHRIIEIRYGDHSILPQQVELNRLVFNYDVRPDKSNSWVAAVKFASTQRLTSIDSWGVVEIRDPEGIRSKSTYQEAPLRSYTLNYGSDSYQRSIITSVQECNRPRMPGVTPTCFAPTQFTWTQVNPVLQESLGGVTVDPANPLPKEMDNLQVSDIDGDGREDLIYTKNEDNALYAWFGSGRVGVNGQIQAFADHETLLANLERDRKKWRLADIDGDGRQDLLHAATATVDNNKWAVSLSQGRGPLATPVELSNLGYGIDASNMQQRIEIRQIKDYTGDGLVDLLVGGLVGQELLLFANQSTPGTVQFGPQQPIDRNDLTTHLQGELGLANTQISVVPIFAQPFEFDGDGASDILLKATVRRCTTPGVTICATSTVAEMPSSDIAVPGAQAPRSGVFGSSNGDNPRWEDVYVAYHVATWNGSGYVAQIEPIVGDELVGDPGNQVVVPMDADLVRMVDVNGDGLADLTYRKNTSESDGRTETLYYRLNIGGALLAEESSVGGLQYLDRSVIIDYDGNGLPDLLYPVKPPTSNAGIWHARLSRNGVFSLAHTTAATAGDFYEDRDPDNGSFLDINGDGLKDHMHLEYTLSEGLKQQIIRFGNNTDPAQVMIKQISDGFGATTKLKYAALTDTYNESTGKGVYARGNNPAVLTNLAGSGPPVFDLTGAMYVVHEAESSAPAAGTSPGDVDIHAFSKVRYRYQAARVQGGGRGLLGFAKITSTELQTQVETETSYHQEFPFTGLPEKTIQYAPGINAQGQAGPVKVSEAANAWVSEEVYPGVHFNYISSSEEKQFNLNGAEQISRVKTDNQYGESPQYGNVTKVTVTTYPDTSHVKVQSQVTDNLYDNDANEWHLGRLTQARVTTERPGQTTVRRQSDFTYVSTTGVSTTGLLESEQVTEVHSNWAPTGRWRKTEYLHDAFGNRIRTTVSGSDIVTRSSSDSYDPLGRYVDGSTNVYGQTTLQVMARDQWGNVLESRDMQAAAEGKESSHYYLYDLMGRPYLEYHRSGAWTRTSLALGAGSYCPTPPTGETKYYRITTTADGTLSHTCFDVLGREVRQVMRGYALSDLIYSDIEYDAFGRVRYQSEPYFNNHAPIWASTEYDVLGRPTAVDQPNGLRTEMDYDGLVTDIENYLLASGTPKLDTARRETRNALGELVQVEDNPSNAFTGPGVQATRLPTAPEQSTTQYSYDAIGNLTLVDGPIGADNMQVTYNSFGHRIELNDPDGGASQYHHDVLGQLICQVNAANEATYYEYDRAGRKTKEGYRDRGNITTAPSANCATEGTSISESTWAYNNSALFSPSMGQLVQESTPGFGGIARSFSYDHLGRLITTTTNTTLNGLSRTYTEATTYDEFGRVFQSFDASGEGVVYYYKNGYLSYTCNARGISEQALYERFETYDARGNATVIDYHGEQCGPFTAATYSSTRSYEADTGLISTITTGQNNVFQDLSFTYDDYGNLTHRKDWNGNQTEDFSYDKLQRLAQIHQITPATTHTDHITYDVGGNIKTKYGTAGGYAYGGFGASCSSVTGADNTPGPHAATQVGSAEYCYDAKGNQISGDGRSALYNVYNKPIRIQKDSKQVDFEYGPNRARFRRLDYDASTGDSGETLYLGGVEISIDSNQPNSRKYRRYASGSLLIEHTEVVGQAEFTATTVRFVHKDHIGSADVIVRMDSTGGGDSIAMVDSRLSFDAFGKRRGVGPWNNASPGNLSVILEATNRGFTGHEMLDGFGIIHMNGRIYDPTLGRFLSADPIVQEPGNGQNLNRYSYVLNNPLTLTDPSGYSFKRYLRTALAIALSAITYGAASGWATTWAIANGYTAAQVAIISHIAGGAAAGFVGGAVQTGTLKGALIGAFSGAAFGAIGASNLSDPLRVLAHGVTGGTISVLQGGDFGHGFTTAGLTKVFSLATRGVLERIQDPLVESLVVGIVGGTVSRVTGGKFANAAVTSAFGYLFNQASTRGADGRGSSSGIPITKMEQELLDIGTRESVIRFYESRLARGDGYAALALDVVHQRGNLGNAANAQLLLEVMIGASEGKISMPEGHPQRFLEKVNVALARLHASHVTSDYDGSVGNVRGLLSSSQIREYHELFFDSLGLSPHTFGGAFFGRDLNPVLGWCNDCDTLP